MVDHLWSGTSGNITLLEKRALRTQAAARQYRDVFSRFRTFCSDLLKTPAQVDSALVTYSNQLHMDGAQNHVGTKLVASWMQHFPEYSLAGIHRLARTARALKGWRNLTSGKTSKAYPLVVWGALAVVLTERQFPSMATRPTQGQKQDCRTRATFLMPSGCFTYRSSSWRWLQEHKTKHLGASCIQVGTTR